jgi:hypothetical protein
MFAQNVRKSSIHQYAKIRDPVFIVGPRLLYLEGLEELMRRQQVTAIVAFALAISAMQIVLQYTEPHLGTSESSLETRQAPTVYEPAILHTWEFSRSTETTLAPTPTPTPTIMPTPSAAATPTPEVINSSSYEHDLFVKIVAAEAGDTWDITGNWLIAKTVVNQLNNGYWGNSLTEVLTYKGNYSVYSNGWYLQQPSFKLEKAEEAVDMVLAGKAPDEVSADDMLYFCTTSHLNNNPNGFHAKRQRVTAYENVVFFK